MPKKRNYILNQFYKKIGPLSLLKYELSESRKLVTL